MTTRVLIERNENPAAKYWLTVLRDASSTAPSFRKAITELGALLAYEALTHAKLAEKNIVTPMEPTVGYEICRKVYLVPILRTGLLMADGMLRTYPLTHVFPIGLRRTPNGALIDYDIELDATDEELLCIIADGVVGTGKTLSRAIEICKGYWPKAVIASISFIGLMPGFNFVDANHPDVFNITLQFDRTENAQGYILPGVGDIRHRAYNLY